MAKDMFMTSTVTVTAVRFGPDFSIYPRRIELEGVSHTFTDMGPQIVSGGDTASRMFVMTDGMRRYTLQNNEDGWKLLSIMS